MQVKKTNSIYFTSYNNPILPFEVKTRAGILTFREINYKHLPKNAFYKKLASFFLDNFANTSAHPFWEKFRKPFLDKQVYNDYIDIDVKNYKKALYNKNTTILLAKDAEKNIVAAMFARPLKETQTVRDSQTLYIDSIAVAPKYRGNNVGARILEKVLLSSQKRFTDAFLVSYKESVPFYEKMGFKHLRWSNPKHQYVIYEMAKERQDYPDYAEFMYKKLNNSELVPWYSRIQRRNIPKD